MDPDGWLVLDHMRRAGAFMERRGQVVLTNGPEHVGRVQREPDRQHRIGDRCRDLPVFGGLFRAPARGVLRDHYCILRRNDGVLDRWEQFVLGKL